MSKADILLKKASSFEKLALYSDRKIFLQVLSEEGVANSLAKTELNQRVK